jgi:hypothetical protein
MAILDTLMRGVREEINTLTSFATTPKGVFETVDEMIRVGRRTVRESIESVGLRIPEFRLRR